MIQIERLLKPGEERLATDLYLTLAHELKPLSENKTWKPGDIQTTAHHLTVRREMVIPIREVEMAHMRLELICAAVEGLSADIDAVEKWKKMAPGASSALTTFEAIAYLSIEIAGATMKQLKEEK